MTSNDKLQQEGQYSYQEGQYSYQEQEEQYFHQWCNILIRRRQYSYQGRQYSYELYNVRLQPYLENDAVGKNYAVEDFNSEILSTQAA